MVNTSQQVGGSIGTALLNTLAAGAVTSFVLGHRTTVAGADLVAQATLHGYRVAFVWSAVIFVTGAAASLLLLRGGVARSASEEELILTVAH
jgi:hypothetical protein